MLSLHAHPPETCFIATRYHLGAKRTNEEAKANLMEINIFMRKVADRKEVPPPPFTVSKQDEIYAESNEMIYGVVRDTRRKMSAQPVASSPRAKNIFGSVNSSMSSDAEM
jgi:hypothetical protein